MAHIRPIIVAGLGYGDEGKGTTVDALARRFSTSTVVRYNGGAQAGHNVVSPDGRHHCFAQFGSGTLTRTSKTLLSRYMVVDLETLVVEADALVANHGVRAPFARMTIDAECLVATPMQKFANRLREAARGETNAHGSCGMGVGETIQDGERGMSVRVRELLDVHDGTRALVRIRDEKRALVDALLRERDDAETRAIAAAFDERADVETLAYRYRDILCNSGLTVDRDGTALRDALAERHAVIFEGAQGVLLDRTRGVAPFVTKSDATMANAMRLLVEANRTDCLKLGVVRAYGHRHGNGPFVAEDEALRSRFDDARNATNRWQGKFRVGWFDRVALQYALAANGGVDELAVTGLDRLSGLERIPICTAYAHAFGARLEVMPNSPDAFAQWSREGSPQWTSLAGWGEDISDARSFDTLPEAARAYCAALAPAGIPLAMVSVGPTAAHKIWMHR